MKAVKDPDERPRAEPPPPPLLAVLDAAGKVIAARLGEHLAAAGYGDQTLAQSRVFGAIPAEGIRLTDLAARLWMTKQAVGELVDQMEAAGYVERRPDPADRRAKLICFTEKGWAAVDEALRIFAELETELDATFGAATMADVRRVVTAIAEG